jgi:hypothetical protein
MMYDNVLTQLYGEERESAIRVMDDDQAFDRWLEDYQRKQALNASAASSPGGGQKRVDKKDFLKKRTYGTGAT